MSHFISQNTRIPELFVVGAGPGDPKLITLAALEAIKSAKVVLYDHLINKELLNWTKSECIKVSVGKKAYQHTISQKEINELIRFYAFSMGNVLRLKSGDPYIFGRGYEELQYAIENNISVTYIPGVSSMQTVGINQIPLTYRGISDGIWILTGTRKDGSLSPDLRLAVQSKSTVVIYMGMSKLSEIARTYSDAGKGDLTACIIENGSLPYQRRLFCQAKNLKTAATRKGFGNPAVIVIGDVVKLSNNIMASDFSFIDHLDENKSFFED